MSKPSIDALRSTVELLDSVSQETFARIKALCKVTLLSMEQHARPVDMEDVARVLMQIEQAADEAENCINGEAENVGCNYKDEAWIRRIDARAAWRALRAGRVGSVDHG